MSRAEILKRTPPHLIADVWLYPGDAGGRQQVAQPGWGCPCMISQMEPLVGRGGLFLLGDDPFAPGERRRVGVFFPAGEDAADVIRRAGRFYLWEGGFIGEARVVGVEPE